MSNTIPAIEAKAHFAEALRRAERGDIVIITRHGKPVAGLVDTRKLDLLEMLQSAEPSTGLTGLVGKYDGGEIFAEEVDRIVASRSLPWPALKRD